MLFIGQLQPQEVADVGSFQYWQIWLLIEHRHWQQQRCWLLGWLIRFWLITHRCLLMLSSQACFLTQTRLGGKDLSLSMAAVVLSQTFTRH